jgi:hypothetical protein
MPIRPATTRAKGQQQVHRLRRRMTTKKQIQMQMQDKDNGKGKGEMRGSLHYAAHDIAVRCSGRDDVVFLFLEFNSFSANTNRSRA